MVSSSEAELVLAGGKIRTPAHPSGFAAALAVRDGLVQAVGSDDEIRELTGRRTRVIDLRGRLARAARHKVEQEFDATREARKLLRLFEHVPA